MSGKPIVMLFGRDLRIGDNVALAQALSAAADAKVGLCALYIWDRNLTDAPGAAARAWVAQALCRLDEDLRQEGLSLTFTIGNRGETLQKLVRDGHTIYLNRTYAPEEAELLESLGENVKAFDGNLLFNPDHTKPYKVFTPFYNYLLTRDFPKPVDPFFEDVAQGRLGVEQASIEQMMPTGKWVAPMLQHWDVRRAWALERLETICKKSCQAADYGRWRDFVAEDGTSRLSPYLAWGLVGVREVVAALPKESALVRQLIWREFAYHSLYRMPWMPQKSIKANFEKFPWAKNVGELPLGRNMSANDISDIKDFSDIQRWCSGSTGYGLVDAGMRQLWQSGWMHNRARMVVASFLIKHLLIDWRVGQRWFWETLVDADLANNAFGWQWVAGCGLDAAPYFRIFNPITQQEKFDPRGEYVKKWGVPEGLPMMVDHKQARERALEALKKTK